MKASYVVDASVAVAWMLVSQSSPATDRLLLALPQGTILAIPALWPFEVANSLLIMLRRRKISRHEYIEGRLFLETLHLSVDDAATTSGVARVADLAEEHGLTVYDAAYLELALRTQLGLASKDEDLVKAARRCGVHLLL